MGAELSFHLSFEDGAVSCLPAAGYRFLCTSHIWQFGFSHNSSEYYS